MDVLSCRWVGLTGVSQLLDGEGDRQSRANIGQEGIGRHRPVFLLPISR